MPLDPCSLSDAAFNNNKYLSQDGAAAARAGRGLRRVRHHRMLLWPTLEGSRPPSQAQGTSTLPSCCLGLSCSTACPPQRSSAQLSSAQQAVRRLRRSQGAEWMQNLWMAAVGHLRLVLGAD